MNTNVVSALGTTIVVSHVGVDGPDRRQIIWGHGWGQSGSSLSGLAESLAGSAFSTLIDFPGFGGSPCPPSRWGTAEYADAVAEWLSTLPVRERLWVGHSFGCRVGVQLAARHPQLISGLVLISAAGLPRRLSFPSRVRRASMRLAYQLAKKVISEGPGRERLRSVFGSADYKTAGPMRSILTKVVTEDLTACASTVRCPTLLIYGDQDQDTPPEMGKRFQALIAHSELVILEGFGHTDIILKGRYQVSNLINRFLRNLR